MKKTKTQKKLNPKLAPAPKRINDAYYWLRIDMTNDDDHERMNCIAAESDLFAYQCENCREPIIIIRNPAP